MNLRNLFIFVLLLHVYLLTSCNGCLSDIGNGTNLIHIDSTKDVIYSTYIALDDDGWGKNDTVVFDLPLVDSGADLDISISVRYTNRYPYQNLQIYAFLAEQDTTDIINSLPLHQNDDVIDSLIRLEDSLNNAKAKAELNIALREAERDSLLITNRDSLLQAERKDSLRKDSIKKAEQQSKESYLSSMTASQRDSLRRDSLVKDSLSKLTIHERDSLEALRKAQMEDSIAESLSRVTKTIDFTLFNNKDHKSGIGMMFIESSVTCGTIHLKGNTRYKIIIYHNMKDKLLKGISDIGITLRRSPTAKPLNKKTRWW